MLTRVDVVWFADISVNEVQKEDDDPIFEHTTQQLLALPDKARDFVALIGDWGSAWITPYLLYLVSCCL